MNLAILLATYNGEMFLAEQLDSLFSQTYTDFVIYAHDDGSTDQTLEILHQYEKKYLGKLVILEYEGTGGARNNFFSLIQRVDADYYMFCDQDDVWLPRKIEDTFIKLREMEKDNPGLPGLVFTDLAVVDAKLNVIADSFMQYCHLDPGRFDFCELINKNIVYGCTLLTNKLCVDIARSIQSIDNFIMHDLLIALIASTCGKVCFLDKSTILYRQHQNNTIGVRKQKTVEWTTDKIFNVIKGIQIEKSKEIVCWQKKMIGEICCFPSVLPENQARIDDLKKLFTTNKIGRMSIYRKYGLLDNSWKNRWKIIFV